MTGDIQSKQFFFPRETRRHGGRGRRGEVYVARFAESRKQAFLGVARHLLAPIFEQALDIGHELAALMRSGNQVERAALNERFEALLVEVVIFYTAQKIGNGKKWTVFFTFSNDGVSDAATKVFYLIQTKTD